MQISRNSLTLLAGAAASALILSACGGGSSTPTSLTQQTINFSAPSTVTVGDTVALSATSSSGLTTFTFASSTPSICTVSGSTVTFVGGGAACSLTASQAGDSNYAAATSAASTVTPPALLTFSSGFAASSLTVEGGSFGGYGGSDLDSWYCHAGQAPSCGSGSDLTPTVTAANSRFYYYYSVPTASSTTGQYTGIYVQAPNVNGVDFTTATTNISGLTVTNQKTLTFTLGSNPEFFANANHNIAILLTLGKVYNGNCYLKLLKVMPITASADTAYSVDLSTFSVSQDCTTGIATASAAMAVSPLSQVDFQANSGGSALVQGGLTTGANSTIVDSQWGGYPTTLAFKGGIYLK